MNTKCLYGNSMWCICCNWHKKLFALIRNNIQNIKDQCVLDSTGVLSRCICYVCVEVKIKIDNSIKATQSSSIRLYDNPKSKCTSCVKCVLWYWRFLRILESKHYTVGLHLVFGFGCACYVSDSIKNRSVVYDHI